MDLFSQNDSQLIGTPLAEKMRPQSMNEFLGIDDLIQKNPWIKSVLNGKFLPSMIFHGAPGTGKTSLARLIGKTSSVEFFAMNAIDSGTKEIKAVADEARRRRRELQIRTLVFIDEIHRLNKGQQDVLLPMVESGEITLIGSTTENPFYRINRALLSRCRLVEFQRVSDEQLFRLIEKVLAHQAQKKVYDFFADTEALNTFINWCDADNRRCLNALEVLLHRDDSETKKATKEDIVLFLGHSYLNYDRQADLHYDFISAFIKSIRGSDSDAALYYLARMLQSGEDPLFIARRMIILASEDVGNADPRAISLAIACAQAVEMIGLPEAGINLAHCVCYLSSAPKSNRSYTAFKKAMQFAESAGSLEVPTHLRSGMIGKEKNYQYPHDSSRSWLPQNYWPEGVSPQKFYEPKDIGFEKQVMQFLEWLKKSEGQKPGS